MIKKKFLLEVEFSSEELQISADAYDVSIEQLTDTQIAQTLTNALSEEFDGITILPLDLTPTPQE